MLQHSAAYMDTWVNESSSNCDEQMRAYSADKLKLDRLLLASSPVVENMDSTGTDMAEEDKCR